MLKKIALSVALVSSLCASSLYTSAAFAASDVDKAKAIAVYNEALEQYKAGNTMQAKTGLENATLLDPDLGAAHYNLAVLLMSLKQYDEAITHFRECLRINPSDDEAKNFLGQNLCYRGKKPEGLALLRSINSSSSAYQSAQAYLAKLNSPASNSSSQQRDVIGGTLAPASQVFFNTVVKKMSESWALRPEGKKWNYSLTSSIVVTVDNDGKRDFSIYRSSRNAEYDNLVMEFCKRTPLPKPPATWNPEQRIAVFYNYKVMEEGKKPDGKTPACDEFSKGMDLFQEEKTEPAIQHFKNALTLDPKLVIARIYLGGLYNLVGKNHEAAAEYREALKIVPNDEEVKFGLAKTYYVLDDLPALKELIATIPSTSQYYAEAQKILSWKNAQQNSQAQSAAQANTQAPAEANKTTVESVVANENSVVKDKWALVIGISKFANPEYNLKFAAKDAQDFYNYLITDGHFQKDHVLLLLNERATRRNIMSAFGDKFLPAVSRDGDLVTIYISTHGTPASKDPGKRNFIIAYDTEAEALYETGVDMDELYRRVKEGVKTERALIVMDTCYSGAGVPGARGVDAGANFDASQVALGSGHLVMTSSSPSERSWESKVTANGVFTKYLIQNLKLTKGNVKNSYEKLKGDVGWEVQNAFNQTQNPQMGGEWKGKELILNAIPTEPRPVLNPDLLKLMNLPNSAPKVVPLKKQ